MPRVVYFEIHVEDPERAIQFYREMPVPGVGWLAYCKDTEGNVFGMMQTDPTAH